MNQHASDNPQNSHNDSHASHVDATNLPSEGQNTDELEPIQACLVEPDKEAPPIRVGSPFAVDPIDPLTEAPAKKIEPFLDVGPIRYTAMGAVAASFMVVGFAAVATWWFPAGGTLITALGCVLSIFGLYSSYRFTSAGLLTVHLCLFVVSYGRSLG